MLLKNLIKKFRVNPLWLCEGEGKMFISLNDTSIIEAEKAEARLASDQNDPEARKKNSLVSEIESQIEQIERQQQYIDNLNSLVQNLRKE